MDTAVELSKKAQDAFNRVLALREVTRTTGTVTRHTQSMVLRQLSPQDLSDVALALDLADENTLWEAVPSALDGGAK